MKKFLTCVAAGMVAVMMGGAASAATIFIGTEPGNDPFPQSFNDSPALAKCDQGAEGVMSPTTCDDWEDGNAPGDYSNAFELTYNSESSFDWSFDASGVTGTTNVLEPIWIAVKAGSDFLVFQVTDGDLAGSVDISNIVGAAISHVSFYDTGPLPDVPLPAAAWLMLAGVAGLGFSSRKKKAV